MVKVQPKVVDPETREVQPRDLRAFCRVVDLGSITAAARTLGETKGSVSRRVGRLEAALGTALLRRSGRAVEATAEGRLYREQAGAALDRLDQAGQVLQDLRSEPSGHLRVTVPIGIGAPLLGPILGPFTERYPAVTIEVVVTDAVLSFAEHRIDVALRLSTGLPDSALLATRLLDIRSALVASPSYLARHGEPRSPRELLDHRLLLPPLQGPRMTLELERDGHRDRLVLPGHVATHDLTLLREAALAGAGITLGPEPLAEADVAAGRLARVLDGWRVVNPPGLWILHARGAVPSRVRAFRDVVVEVVRDGGCATRALAGDARGG